MKKLTFLPVISAVAVAFAGSLSAQIINITPAALDTPVRVNLAVQGSQAAVVYNYGINGNGLPGLYLDGAFSSNSGSTFSAPTTLAASWWVRQLTPNLKYDGSGNLNMMWAYASDTDPTRFQKSTDNGATWGNATSTGGSTLSRSGGNAYVISGSTIRALSYESWDGNGQMKLSTNGGATWVAATNVDLQLPGSTATGAALANSGKMFAVTSINPRYSAAQAGVRIESLTSNGTWAAHNVYDTDTQAQISLANDHNILNVGGTILATYALSGNVTTVSTADEGTIWTSPMTLTLTGNATAPVIAGLSDNTSLMLAWIDTAKIFYKMSGDAGATWGTTTAFAGFGNGTVTSLDLVSDGSGFQAAWIEDSKVYYSAIPEPSTFAMLGLGAAGIALLRRRNASRRS